jgi:DNA-binding transcriptional LysR family regulator
VLDDLKDAEDAATGAYSAPKGELSITAPMGFGRLHLQPVAIEFLAAYPQINLRLLLVDRVVDIIEEHVDLALRIATLPDSSMIAKPLGEVGMVVSASPEYLKRNGSPQHPSELTARDCIAWSSMAPLNTWNFRIGATEHAVPIRTRLATTSAESAIAAAQSGLGITQTTTYQAEHSLRDGSLQLLLREFETATMPVNLVYASNRLVPLKMRSFIDFSAPRLTKRLQAIKQIVDR